MHIGDMTLSKTIIMYRYSISILRYDMIIRYIRSHRPCRLIDILFVKTINVQKYYSLFTFQTDIADTCTETIYRRT